MSIDWNRVKASNTTKDRVLASVKIRFGMSTIQNIMKDCLLTREQTMLHVKRCPYLFRNTKTRDMNLRDKVKLVEGGIKLYKTNENIKEKQFSKNYYDLYVKENLFSCESLNEAIGTILWQERRKVQYAEFKELTSEHVGRIHCASRNQYYVQRNLVLNRLISLGFELMEE